MQQDHAGGAAPGAARRQAAAAGAAGRAGWLPAALGASGETGAGEDPRGTAAGTGGIAPYGCLCPGVRRGRRGTEPAASVTPR